MRQLCTETAKEQRKLQEYILEVTCPFCNKKLNYNKCYYSWVLPELFINVYKETDFDLIIE